MPQSKFRNFKDFTYMALLAAIVIIGTSLASDTRYCRTSQGKRHLLQKYKDLFTGKDFVEIRTPFTNGITGVYSSSEEEPPSR